ncbi:MAG: amidohydrolase family protein, partial [Halocynthiibacter sp.]
MRLAGGQVYDSETRRFSKRDLFVETGHLTDRSEGETIELDGAWLLPGFFDCHVHVAMNTEKASSINVWAGAMPGDIVLYAARAARRTLMCGITTARDVGGWDYHEIAVR